MDVKLLVCSLLLILLVPCNGSGSKEIVRTMPLEHVHAHPDIMAPRAKIFFEMKDLKPGHTMPIYFPNGSLDDVFPHFLSKHDADAIPFSSDQFHNILQFFSIPEDSERAITMQKTLKGCEKEPMPGEVLSCPTSMESMENFARMVLGSQTELEYVATIYHTKSSVLLQNYTIIGVRQIAAPKAMGCHHASYPYTVFFCHVPPGGSTTFRVSLTGENGDEIDAVAMCHMDTSMFGRSHVSFQLLGIEPGANTPVCHFFPAIDLVWIPKKTESSVIRDGHVMSI